MFFLVFTVQTPHLWSFQELLGLVTLSEPHLPLGGKAFCPWPRHISLTTIRPDSGHTCGDIAHPLSPGTRCLGKGSLCHQGVRNSLRNEEKRQHSKRALCGWGGENSNRDACSFMVMLSWLGGKGCEVISYTPSRALDQQKDQKQPSWIRHSRLGY